jgi:hypothetical protein
MPVKPLVSISIAAFAAVAVVVSGVALTAHEAEADDPAGATAGPWRCKAFSSEGSIEQQAASWLYRYASTGPGTIGTVGSPSPSGRSGTTLCAWDPGFAGKQWMEEEQARRAHEEQVKARKRAIRKRGKKAGEELFLEDVPLEAEGAAEPK